MQRGKQPFPAQLPQSYGSIQPAARNQPHVDAERHAPNAGGVTTQRGQQSPFGCRPHAHSFIRAAADQHVPVGRQGDVPHPACDAPQCRQAASAGRLLLRITRRDWATAKDLVSHVQLEMADAALKHFGLEPGRDVTVVTLRDNRLTALEAGTVDAAADGVHVRDRRARDEHRLVATHAQDQVPRAPAQGAPARVLQAGPPLGRKPLRAVHGGSCGGRRPAATLRSAARSRTSTTRRSRPARPARARRRSCRLVV